MVDVSGLADHSRRQSRPVQVPNAQNRTRDRPIPSENIAGDPELLLLARAPLQHDPTILRQAFPHAWSRGTFSPRDEYHRRYRTNWRVRDSAVSVDHAKFLPIVRLSRNRPRRRRTIFASGSRPDGAHAVTAHRFCKW